jgi:hypothetical protein
MLEWDSISAAAPALSPLTLASNRASWHLLRRPLGCGLQGYDRPVVNEITRTVAASGYGFQMLVREVVRNLPFQSWRAETVIAVAAK